ncbi:MAG: ferredoxin--NADP(+) reductase [Alphaproteobacteria bacterium RIFCSPLOWO2_01_FULL_40_26]|nr:MAG: ferredoxin--NADP(+) reductase [Alphaproteobacteria bacterium RIFCSPHIGHO2_02_FULL_40_34]OFW94708.1 MAG: ferredoxin--NADP(+) reductase [Alphaproteobacteria bacterium RIFCSPLOWO2_01_FULL_40_26]OFX10180.1 MAG: ferredoxin--NADP(+) reductase [Alphaproteobacteria bacterium RIFCSPLOWO2_02_FULL_40_19]OFX11811.1 MAG: ferredoxin--NADP(+) reductase [Alphaproteobacteria bacterium RIFCSPLOWO2_12_FULL_40_11]
MHNTDLVIVGAGPAGLFSVFEAGMLKIKSHVIDTLEIIGGQCLALYPEKPIYDIPAHPKILASELIEMLEVQAAPFHPIYHLNQCVEKISRNSDGTFVVETSKNTKINCKAIVVAAGCGAFGPNRPPLAGLEEFEGKSVFYAVRNKAEFAGKNVVIAGGGDSAVDWAIGLSEIAKKIYVVHRRDKFRCAPESADKMKKLAENGKIELVIPFQLDGLEGNGGKLSHVMVKDFDGNIKKLSADYLLPFFGLAMELGPIANWGLNLEKNHIAVDPTTMQTSEKGIYAIGDIATYKNKLKLILTGFAEAATAAHDIYKIVHPNQIFHFEYSTSKGITS